MNIMEAVGSVFIIYLACSGLAGHVYLVVSGVRRIVGRLEIGGVYEDAAVREQLVIRPLSTVTGE
jgi:hypothetical protein